MHLKMKFSNSLCAGEGYFKDVSAEILDIFRRSKAVALLRESIIRIQKNAKSYSMHLP